ncbi:hypothetical protein LTR04_000870 [Oleoguttula sp. CCFEE 6159]|nr:hypothetical protein LTR04_000870 [Oleoguttula sp. CCFEE 6159]
MTLHESQSVCVAATPFYTSALSAQRAGRSQSSSPAWKALRKHNSGESSSAEHWFDQSNNHVSQDCASFVDLDPPFFLRDSSPVETPPHHSEQQAAKSSSRNGPANYLPYRAGLLGLGTDESSTEDFRGVIDDLTIENKKLKRRLKKYEQLHDYHLQDKKPFEIRVHGLPVEKKRELEETLKRFALGLDDTSERSLREADFERSMPRLTAQNTTSSYVSNHFADSAYASMSASGQASSTPSGQESRLNRPARSAKSRQQNIQSYLHDIPESLLPQHPASMTEKAKKKLIVRRLEQVFAGKGAAADGHHQPLQQQEISQLAASADRSAIEASGEQAVVEGLREARIMMDDTGEPMDSLNVKTCSRDNTPAESPQRFIRTPMIVEHGLATRRLPICSTSDQRPTRPLDLDPGRAQVVGSVDSPGAGHAWIYLNLLINMAQLHTINVTTEFVKKALNEYSLKFELSPDGRKVRWNGGCNLTHTNSLDDGSSPADRTSGNSSHETAIEEGGRNRVRKMQRPGGTSTVHHMRQARNRALSKRRGAASKFSYTPLFFHRDSTDDSEDSPGTDNESLTGSFWQAAVADHSESFTSEVFHKSLKTKHDDGPIIFYKELKFCTDLSGDSGVYNPPLFENANYQRLNSWPLGATPDVSIHSQRLREPKGSLTDVLAFDDPMDLDDAYSSTEEVLVFPSQSPLEHQPAQALSRVDLGVSGVGGVYPDDHFTIEVACRRVPFERHPVPEALMCRAPRPYLTKIVNVLGGRERHARTDPRIVTQVIAVTREDLAPSSLPPASCVFFLSESSLDDEDSDAESDLSDFQVPFGGLPSAAAPQLLNVTTDSVLESSAKESYLDDESDGSLDLLATAREIDPATIRAREREYDSNMAERLAEEIPAGSSAATAGGGSGFASPVDGVDSADYVKAKSRQKTLTRKRARTDDSMAVHSKAPRLE